MVFNIFVVFMIPELLTYNSTFSAISELFPHSEAAKGAHPNLSAFLPAV
jgi:hypothetical protein